MPGFRVADRLSGHLCHHLPQTSWTWTIAYPIALIDLSLSTGSGDRLVGLAVLEHCPDNASQLVGQRHDDGVLVCPDEQVA